MVFVRLQLYYCTSSSNYVNFRGTYYLKLTNQNFAAAGGRRNEKMGVFVASVPSSLAPRPPFFSRVLAPLPLPLPRNYARCAGYQTHCGDVWYESVAIVTRYGHEHVKIKHFSNKNAYFSVAVLRRKKKKLRKTTTHLINSNSLFRA